MLDLIETILVYKFPQLTSQEIGTMLGLAESAEHTRVYQDAHKKGRLEEKQEMALKMLAEGMALDLIARLTDLPIDQINALRPNPQA